MLETIAGYFRGYPILWAPVISLGIFLVSLLCRLIAQRRNKKKPGAVKKETLEKYKICTMVFGSIATITCILIGGGMLLLYFAVEFM